MANETREGTGWSEHDSGRIVNNLPQAHHETLARLHRAHGQLGGLINMMEQDRSRTEVLTQLAAIIHALHRAGFRLVADELQHCRDESGGCDRQATQQLEKLFLALG